MKRNNKVFRGKTIDNMFRKNCSNELLPNALRTLTEFLDMRKIIEPKSWMFFCFIQFFSAENKENLLVLQFRLNNLIQA